MFVGQRLFLLCSNLLMSDGENCSVLLSFVVVHTLPHQPTHLELHFTFCGDVDFFQSFGILCSSCRSFFNFEDSKVAKLQAVVLAKLRCYLIEELLHYFFANNILTLSILCYSVDKFFFCYCCHQQIPKPDCVKLPRTV